MEFLTLGQVIDKIKVGDVAIPIEVMSGNIPYGNYGHNYCDIAFYLDDVDFYLKTIDGRMITGIVKPPEMTEEKYILISRDQYESLISRL